MEVLGCSSVGRLSKRVTRERMNFTSEDAALERRGEERIARDAHPGPSITLDWTVIPRSIVIVPAARYATCFDRASHTRHGHQSGDPFTDETRSLVSAPHHALKPDLCPSEHQQADRDWSICKPLSSARLASLAPSEKKKRAPHVPIRLWSMGHGLPRL